MNCTTDCENTSVSNTSSGTPTCIDDSDEWEHTFYVMKVSVISTLIVIGIFGNITSYWVLSQRSYKNNVMAIALRYLAVIDTIIVLNVDLEMFISSRYGLNFDYLTKYRSLCVFQYHFRSFLMSLDAWMLIYITTTRYIHIRFPFKSHVLCSKFNYFILVILMHVILTGTYFAIIIAAFINWPENIPDGEICYFVGLRTEAKNPFIRVIVTQLCFAIPLAVVCVVNVLTIHQLWVVNARRKVLMPGAVSHTAETSTTANRISNQFSHSPSTGLNNNNDTNDQLETSRKPTESKQSRKRPYVTNDGNPKYHSTHKGSNVDQLSLPLSSRVGNVIGLVPSKTSTTDTVRSWLSTSRLEPISFEVDVTEADLNMEITKTSFFNVTTDVVDEQKEQMNKKMKKHLSKERQNRINSLTTLLTVSSLVYITTTVPQALKQYYANTNLISKYIPGCWAQLFFIYIVFFVQLTNYSVNFYFYAAIGTQFRKELIRLWRRHFCRSRETSKTFSID